MPKAPSAKKSSTIVVPAAPKDWTKMYRAIVFMRRFLQTPVDVIGCHRLADRTAEPELIRFQTLLALMLSSQTRDQCTATAMRNLIAIKGGCHVANIAKASEAQIKTAIASVCFYNNKAKYILKTSKKIVDEHSGNVPSTLKELVALPGVGYKMAGIFLECADGKVECIGIDTHMHRNFARYGWVKNCDKPDDTMKALQVWLPLPYWKNINEIMVGFGQLVCKSAAPLCTSCTARHWCPAADLDKKQIAEEKKKNLAGLEGKARELQDLEDIATLQRETQATREKLVAEWGNAPSESDWWYPSSDNEKGGAAGDPKLIQSQHLAQQKKKATTNKYKTK